MEVDRRERKFSTAPSPVAKNNRRKWDSILWVESSGFSLIIGLSWLSEALRFPHYVFGEPLAPNWSRAALRTIVIGAIWIWVHFLTRRLLKRLHYLEEFMRVCAWCRKVSHDDEWLTMEQYFKHNFSTRTTHGLCPECMARQMKDLEMKEKAIPSPD
jgi:hypothetical protein